MTLSKRLCPLISLALAFGCGKKINEPKSSDGDRTSHTQTTELPATLSLHIDEAVSPVTTYKLQRNAWFRLPTKLKARQGNGTGKQVKIFYNMFSNGDYEFHCIYKSVSSVTELAFVKCESSDNIEIISKPSDLSSMDFPMDKDSSIKLQLTNPSDTATRIEAAFEVDWK